MIIQYTVIASDHNTKALIFHAMTNPHRRHPGASECLNPGSIKSSEMDPGFSLRLLRDDASANSVIARRRGLRSNRPFSLELHDCFGVLRLAMTHSHPLSSRPEPQSGEAEGSRKGAKLDLSAPLLCSVSRDDECEDASFHIYQRLSVLDVRNDKLKEAL